MNKADIINKVHEVLGSTKADAERAVEAVFGRLLHQVFHATGLLGDVELSLLQNAHSRGVVAPILEALEPLEEDGNRFLLTDVADNAAHVIRKGLSGFVLATIPIRPNFHKALARK